MGLLLIIKGDATLSRQLTDKEPSIELNTVGNSLTIAAVKRKAKLYDVGHMIEIAYKENRFVVTPLADARIHLKVQVSKKPH
jgi:hypothetical protein